MDVPPEERRRRGGSRSPGWRGRGSRWAPRSEVLGAQQRPQQVDEDERGRDSRPATSRTFIVRPARTAAGSPRRRRYRRCRIRAIWRSVMARSVSLVSRPVERRPERVQREGLGQVAGDAELAQAGWTDRHRARDDRPAGVRRRRRRRCAGRTSRSRPGRLMSRRIRSGRGSVRRAATARPRPLEPPSRRSRGHADAPRADRRASRRPRRSGGGAVGHARSSADADVAWSSRPAPTAARRRRRAGRPAVRRSRCTRSVEAQAGPPSWTAPRRRPTRSIALVTSSTSRSRACWTLGGGCAAVRSCLEHRTGAQEALRVG